MNKIINVNQDIKMLIALYPLYNPLIHWKPLQNMVGKNANDLFVLFYLCIAVISPFTENFLNTILPLPLHKKSFK